MASPLPARLLILPSFLIISSTAWPFSASAPVGHTCTHLPQLVQLRASPHGRFISATTME